MPPFHCLLRVPSNIALLYTPRFQRWHEILHFDLLEILTAGCQHWIGQSQCNLDRLWVGFITRMNK
jgi:hypothetical protein